MEYTNIACCCSSFRYWFTSIFTVTTCKFHSRIQRFTDSFPIITYETKTVIHSRYIVRCTLTISVLDTIHRWCIWNRSFTCFWCYYSFSIFYFYGNICRRIPVTIISTNCIFWCIFQVSRCFCCRNIYLRSIFTIFSNIFQC